MLVHLSFPFRQWSDIPSTDIFNFFMNSTVSGSLSLIPQMVSVLILSPSPLPFPCRFPFWSFRLFLHLFSVARIDSTTGLFSVARIYSTTGLFSVARINSTAGLYSVARIDSTTGLFSVARINCTAGLLGQPGTSSAISSSVKPGN